MKYVLSLLLAFTIIQARNCDFQISDSLCSKADFKTTYGGFGVGYSDLGKLNRNMQSNGFDRMDQGIFLITGGEKYHYKRFIVGGEFTGYLWNIAESDTRRNLQGGFDVSLISGFDIISKEEISLFPYMGLGLGALTHHMAYKDLPFTSVSKGNSASDETLWQPTAIVKFGLGFERDLPSNKTNTIIGLRAGYTVDISDGDRWYRDFSTVADGPSLKQSGPFVMLTVGVKSKE